MVARFLDRTDARCSPGRSLTKVARPRDRLSWRCGSAIGGMPGLLDPWHRWDAPHYTDIAVFGYMANDPGNLSVPGLRAGLSRRPRPLHRLLPALPVAHRGGERRAPRPDRLRPSSSRRSPRCSWRRCSTASWPPTSASASASGRPASSSSSRPRTSSTSATPRASSWRSPSARCGWRGRTAGGSPASSAALAALTRINGLILAPALAVEAWLQWRADPDRRLRVAWLAIAGVAIGFGIYLGVNQDVYGDPFAFSEIQRAHWFKDLTWPWEGIAGMVGWIDARDAGLRLHATAGWSCSSSALGLVATVATAIWLRPTWAVWMAGNWMLTVSTGFVISVPRYSLVAVRDHGVGRDDRRPLARGRLGAGGGIGGGDGATSPGASAPAMGVLSLREPGQRNVPKEPRRSLR